MNLLTQEEIEEYVQIVDSVSEVERKKIYRILEQDRILRCRESFIYFVTQMWPVFISGKHHQDRKSTRLNSSH